jgi:hypothetical protein
MKKFLLSSLVFAITLSVFAQHKFAEATGPGKDIKVRQEQVKPDQVNPIGGEIVPGQKYYDNTIIGTTWYDLQSYTNVMQRLWAYPDGTIGATWMCAGQNLSPERGTGYNYYDGNEWGTPNLHVGPSNRMGWPSYAPWGPNGEILAQYRYVAGEGPIQFYKRENKGEGDWIETILEPPAGNSLVWHSIMTSGENHEYIHVLAYTYDIEYQGQTNALLYYRSSDGAETWEVDGMVIDGLGSDYFPTIHSLTYAWANPVGSTIAFTYGFDEWGGWVFKSEDNGDTWESIHVMDTEVDPFDPPSDLDFLPCGTGTSSCVLDSQGNVHLVFSRMVKVYSNDTLYYYPTTDGLIYWNESMPMIDTTLISSYTLQLLAAAGNLCGYVISSQPTYVIPSDQPSYQTSLCSFPQLSIDGDDNIFVVMNAIAPDYSNGTYFYRHILANSTMNAGNAWGEPFDLNEDIQYIFSECAYPMMAPVIDDVIHVVFQEDPFPGIYEWLANHGAVSNNIMYMPLDKEIFVGVNEKFEGSPVRLSVYPNPATDFILLNINLQQEGEVSVRLLDQVGNCIYLQEKGKYDQGRHLIRLDVSVLPAGIYVCAVEVNGHNASGKLVVY